MKFCQYLLKKFITFVESLSHLQHKSMSQKELSDAVTIQTDQVVVSVLLNFGRLDSSLNDKWKTTYYKVSPRYKFNVFFWKTCSVSDLLNCFCYASNGS